MAFISPLPVTKTISSSPKAPRRPLHRTLRSFQHPVRPLRFPVCSQQPLILTEDNVNVALEEARQTLSTLFGNNPENRSVGITGDVELASLDGPIVVLRLKGRFWHKRTDVLARVSSYLSQRIPEICETAIEDISQLDDEDSS